jgi:fructose-bisphosphate aldolase class I
MPAPELQSTVTALLGPRKGLLAADESFKTIGKRFEALGIASTEESRRAYRGLLVTAPALAEHISGVILYDETIRQALGGTLMPCVLSKRGIIPGIKVDKGTVALPCFAAEKFTQGLDGLGDRLAEYWRLGARFTKWRAVIGIGEGLPTRACIEANAHALALFAAMSQEAGLVPIVEPEVLMDGDHTLACCEEVTGVVLRAVFSELFSHRVVLETMLLKTGMVLSGKESSAQADTGEVAEATIRCLRRAVPASVPGVVFLSGGQEGIAATQRLNAICGAGGAPWKLSFSFGRALQDAALTAWRGSAASVEAAQAALLHRARCNGLAVQGRYSEAAERANPEPELSAAR